MEAIAPFLPLLGIAFVFWLLIIRPQSRRNRELVSMQQSIAVGDEVMLPSGIQGPVRGLAEDTFAREVAPGGGRRVARGAGGRIVARDDARDEPAGPEEL